MTKHEFVLSWSRSTATCPVTSTRHFPSTFTGKADLKAFESNLVVHSDKYMQSTILSKNTGLLTSITALRCTLEQNLHEDSANSFDDD